MFWSVDQSGVSFMHQQTLLTSVGGGEGRAGGGVTKLPTGWCSYGLVRRRVAAFHGLKHVATTRRTSP